MAFFSKERISQTSITLLMQKKRLIASTHAKLLMNTMFHKHEQSRLYFALVFLNNTDKRTTV